MNNIIKTTLSYKNKNTPQKKEKNRTVYMEAHKQPFRQEAIKTAFDFLSPILAALALEIKRQEKK